MKVYGQLERAQIENLTADPTGVNLVVGLVWFRTDLNLFRWYDGAQVREAVDLDSAQTLINKTLTAPIMSDPEISGVTTYSEVVGTPANPAAGKSKFYFKDDGLYYTLDSEGNEVPIGSGSGGGLDVFHTEDFEINNVADFDSGNNATFLGGGVLAGALSDVNTIAGNRNLRYTQAAGSLNDYFASPAFDIDPKQAGNNCGVTLYFKYDGNADDIKIAIYDGSNVINSELDLLTDESNPTRFSINLDIPLGTTSLRWGAQVVVENIGAILELDDIQFTTDPTVYREFETTEEYWIDQPTTAVTNLAGEFEFNLGTANFIKDSASGFEVVDDAANTRTKININRDGSYFINFSANALVNSVAAFRINDADQWIFGSSFGAGGGNASGVGARIDLKAGDFVTFGFASEGNMKTFGGGGTATATRLGSLKIVASYTSEHILAPVNESLSNWEESIPVTQGIGTPTITEFRTRRVGDSLEMMGNIISGTPTAVELQINLPNSLQVQSTLGSGVHLGNAFLGGSSNGGFVRGSGGDSYVTFGLDNSVGPIDGNLALLASSVLTFNCVIPIEGWSGDAKLLAAIPVQKVAILKDVKANNVNGGTFTSGAWQTRDLNTVSGDSGFVSLISNQFTLPSGTYKMRSNAPAYEINSHQSRLRNITDSVSYFGSSAYAEAANGGMTESVVTEYLTLLKTTTFEIQHRCQTSGATTGFGVSAGTAVDGDEVYTQVEITKIK